MDRLKILTKCSSEKLELADKADDINKYKQTAYG